MRLYTLLYAAFTQPACAVAAGTALCVGRPAKLHRTSSPNLDFPQGTAMNFRTSFTAVALAFVAVSSFAQAPAASTATPRVDARQAVQEKRIEQGVATGALTAKETHRLDREQARVVKAETAAKADGTVTPAERKKLHHMQNAASKDIAKQKHDAQTTTSVPAAAPTK
jgi:hypothetical protein